MRVIRYDELAVSRWKNGAGRKADVAAGDGWMVGFAWLDADAPFSDFSGHDRTIMLVDGPGFTLDFPGGRSLAATEPLVPVALDGGWPTFCRIAGPSRVLNVMPRRDDLVHRLVVGAGSGSVPSAPALAQFLVVLRGTVHLSGAETTATLGAGDGVELDQPLTATTPDHGLLARIVLAHKDR